MDSERINPYQAPLAINEPVPFWKPVKTRVPLVSVLLATFAYHGFVLVLLQSTPGDQQAGRLFLLNTPVMAIWIVCLWCAYRHCAFLGVVAATVQVVIASLMVVRNIGDVEIVVTVNGGIALGWLSPAAICWYTREGRSAQGLAVH